MPGCLVNGVVVYRGDPLVTLWAVWRGVDRSMTILHRQISVRRKTCQMLKNGSVPPLHPIPPPWLVYAYLLRLICIRYSKQREDIFVRGGREKKGKGKEKQKQSIVVASPRAGTTSIS